jgi:hypothetical protein
MAFVGIGTYERSLEFCELVKFPKEYLYADPENKVYDALQLVKSSPLSLFTDARTPLALANRIKENRTKDLEDALKTWKAWIPPKLDQGLQQGGCVVFDGYKTLYARKDPAVGDHVDLRLVLELLLSK